MKNKSFDFIKNRKYFLIGYAAIILAGIIVFSIFGANLSIDFKGGTVFTYSYSGNIDLNDAEKVISDTLSRDVTVTESKGYNSESKNLVVMLIFLW